jgi:hypothetical protein
VTVPFPSAKAGAAGAPPAELAFQSPPQVVTAGQTVTLQWATVPTGDFVLLFMPKPYPSGFDFSSQSDVIWPPSSGGGWNSTWGLWSTTNASVSVLISKTSLPGTAYTFDLFTCNLASGCSTDDQVTLTVVDMATFGTSSMAVIAGTTASLHWRPPKAGDYFVLTMPSSSFPLTFSSKSVVTWSSPFGAWHPAYRFWVSTADAVSISIPKGAPAGASFVFDLITCNLSSQKCSNAPGGPGAAAVTMTVAGPEWSVIPYSSAFTMSMARQSGGGVPLDTTISPTTDVIFDSNEFSNSVGSVAPSQTSVSLQTDAWDSTNKPFVSCVLTCAQSGSSDLGERVFDANGLVWLTQGGALFYSGAVPNHSEIVAYDPSSGGICTYTVPGNNPEVTGLVATGSGPNETVWFAAMGSQALESFVPSQVGENCANSPYYSLVGQSSFHQVQLPVPPAVVAADPNGSSMWVSGLFGEVDRVDLRTGNTTRYTLGATNRYYCLPTSGGCIPMACPWQIVSDGAYAYAIDYGDNNLVRINETTGQLDESPMPVVSDTEQGYGLTVVRAGTHTRLYFTLSQDTALASTWTFGMTTTFGWVDLTSWSAASSQPSKAVVYTGLDSAISSTPSDFRGISSGPTGDLAIADSSLGVPEGVIHLSR